MAGEIALDAAQIARMAGVARGTVATWRRRRDGFPAPGGDARAGAAYDRAAVEAWLAGAGLWELAPGPRVWREVSHGVQGTALGEAVRHAAAVAVLLGAGEALPPGVPGNLAWLMERAVADVGAAAVVNDLLDRYAAASGIPVIPARVAECMISLAGGRWSPPSVRAGESMLPAPGRLERVTLTHKEIFERYLYAGASRDPDAQAAMFTEDGVYETPLVPDGHRLPRRLAGRSAIRAGISAFHPDPASQGAVNAGLSRLVLHDTADADVFIAELDAVLDHPGGHRETVSLVQIFRVRDGQIAMLRDYFTAPLVRR